MFAPILFSWFLIGGLILGLMAISPRFENWLDGTNNIGRWTGRQETCIQAIVKFVPRMAALSMLLFIVAIILMVCAMVGIRPRFF